MVIVLIGGNEFRIDDGIDAWIAERTPRIGFINFAKDNPTEQIRNLSEVYKRLNSQITLLDDPNQSLESDVGAVYMTGGHPDRLISYLKDSVLWQSIVARKADHSFILAGSSAGAMVIYRQMLAHGSRMSGDTELCDGLGLLGKEIVAPHWNSADPIWKTRIVHEYRSRGVLAIDENTAYIWTNNGNTEVIGVGEARLIKGE